MSDDVMTRLMRVVEDGRCTETDAFLALGAWNIWHHHPSLRSDLYDDGTADLQHLGDVLGLAGLDAPWGDVRERSEGSSE